MTYYYRLSLHSDLVDHMKKLISDGQIDQALIEYQQLGIESADVYNMIGTFYAQRKGDFHIAIQYYNKALEIREKVNY